MKKIIALFQKYKEQILYLVFGVLTTVVDILVFSLLTHTLLRGGGRVEEILANVVAWVAAVAFAYVTNRIFVFESRDTRVLFELLRFTGSRALTLLIDTLIILLFTAVLSLNADLANIVANLIVIVLNYVISKLFVFRKQR
jgi:putative flippase GtrA